jgi:hypothetical protein
VNADFGNQDVENAIVSLQRGAERSLRANVRRISTKNTQIWRAFYDDGLCAYFLRRTLLLLPTDQAAGAKFCELPPPLVFSVCAAHVDMRRSQ